MEGEGRMLEKIDSQYEYVRKVLVCFVIGMLLMSMVPGSAVAMQSTSESGEQIIPVPGSVRGSADFSKPWKGIIEVPSGLKKLKVEIDSGDVCSIWVHPDITDPLGNKYGFIPYNSIPYSGPSRIQYFIFEKPQPGKWKIEISSDKFVDFTVTTKTEKSINNS